MSKQSRARAVRRTAPPSEPNLFFARWGRLLAGVAIVLAVLAAYCNSFSGPFIFDDDGTITGNSSIRHLSSALAPPIFSTTGGRPVFNLTLAINYAINGMEVKGYHALNLAIHILAGLVLFGVVRRTLLERPTSNNEDPTSKANHSLDVASNPRAISLESSFAEAATLLAFAVALLWALHPLQTESVSYISQRAESLMGLFYLLTLYCFIRGADAEKSRVKSQESRGTPTSISRLSTLSAQLWFTASVLCCLLGMASKEVMVSAPLMVLLYDRTFVAGTFREAWAKRRLFYASLAATWLLLGYLVATTHGRGGTAGFGTSVTWWSYALTQFRAIVHYLRLSLWPDPLVLDYGTGLATRAVDIVPYALIVLLLATGTAIALRRRPAAGFVGCWFFAILAPTSSVVPVATQTMAEHRMYLALAAVVVPVVLGLYAWLGRRSAVIFLALGVGLGCVTVQRNKAYHDALTLWSDTVAQCPDNMRAHDNLGNLLVKMSDRISDAIAEYQTAIKINSGVAKLHINLGDAWLKVPGHSPDAMAEYEIAVRLDPRSPEAHNNLGSVLLDVPGRLPDAMAEFEAVLRIDPRSVDAHNNLGTALLKIPGRLPDAITQYEAAVRLDPDSMETHSNLGSALLKVPARLPDAIAQYEAAVRLGPDVAETHYNLGNALLNAPGRLPDAIAQLKMALRLNPDLARAREMLDQLQN